MTEDTEVPVVTEALAVAPVSATVVKSKLVKPKVSKPKVPKVTKPKAAKKAEPKKVPAKPKGEKVKPAVKKTKKNEKRQPGPAMKALAGKVKENRVLGVCMRKGCSTKTVTHRAKWCREHKKAIRKAQLAANNVVWKRRVLKHEAGHHVAYRNEATKWSATHKDKALDLAKKGHSVYEVDKLKKILAKVKAA